MNTFNHVMDKIKQNIKKRDDAIENNRNLKRNASLDAILKASGGGISTTPIRVRDIDELPQPVKKIYVDTHSPKFN